MIVEILKSCKHTGVKKGEQYHAIRYWIDPMEKVTLQKRIPDGHDPQCNEYLSNVKRIKP